MVAKGFLFVFIYMQKHVPVYIFGVTKIYLFIISGTFLQFWWHPSHSTLPEDGHQKVQLWTWSPSIASVSS